MDQSRVGGTSRRAVLQGIGLGGASAALIAAGWQAADDGQEAMPATQ